MTAALVFRILFASVPALLTTALQPSSALGDPLPPPAVSGPGAFVGVWGARDSDNRHFRLTISDSNGVLTGKLEALDGNVQYGGMLTQQPETTVGFAFAYTYEQPAISGSGTGEFALSPNARKFIGQTLSNDAVPVRLRWSGDKMPAN